MFSLLALKNVLHKTARRMFGDADGGGRVGMIRITSTSCQVMRSGKIAVLQTARGVRNDRQPRGPLSRKAFLRRAQLRSGAGLGCLLVLRSDRNQARSSKFINAQ